MSSAAKQSEPWRTVPLVPRHVANELNESPSRLGRYLSEAFQNMFGLEVGQVTFDMFPGGLFATLYVEGKEATAHNVWAVNMAAGLQDAGVEVNVVVLPASSRHE
jgi:hypothetical protein